MIVTYHSNNSGGSWWLKDEDWKNLETAGWKVEWDNWLGSVAKSASFECETPGDAMKEFEKITGQKVSEEGCNCCGAPHNFEWNVNSQWDYVSGEQCLRYLYPKAPQKSLREFMEDSETKEF